MWQQGLLSQLPASSLWLRRHMDQLQNASRIYKFHQQIDRYTKQTSAQLEYNQDTVHQSIQELLGTKKTRTGTVSNFCAGWHRCCWKMFTTQTSNISAEDWPATVICYFSAPSATGSPISSNHVFMFFSQISWSSKSQTHNTKHDKKQHNNQSVIFYQPWNFFTLLFFWV